MSEIWKDIPGYEGYYQISNMGNVRSLDRAIEKGGRLHHIKGHPLRQSKNRHGYYIVGFSKDDKRTYNSVHRLVAELFIPNPNGYPCVNHKDEDKTNNCVSNLEWCNHLYNINYGTAKERISKSNLALQKGTKVAQYKGDKMIAIFANSIEASRETGVDSSAIRKVCLGRKKYNTAGGYIWRDI
jgi:hypothetical protein